ncbi:DNA ligase D [Heyndrickxia vini]|uniref:DNA ligase (ATP) n=1 Tax=Heyndrickxia vini TaxID=1476025 RepID=A0ABX7E765_9BACI|nr:DNA ligase D [Heyndrickxia vini]QQZ11128.1 DNA ligase D [Heyndrickxia vini]
MKPMLPTLKTDPPLDSNWIYEIKYDGFRAILEWNHNVMHLWSRNEKDLLPQFPEIETYLMSINERVKDFLPLILDGEIVVLENSGKANFGELQIRGRLKSEDKISEYAKKRQCKLLVFDLLKIKGQSLISQSLAERKYQLNNFINRMELPTNPTNASQNLIQQILSEKDFNKVWKRVKSFDGEGIVAKTIDSKWEEGKRTETWVKLKNWKKVSCFIIGLDSSNGYYHIGVYKDKIVYPLGLFLFSIDADKKRALNKVIKENAYASNHGLLNIHPSICVDIYYLEWFENKLREPHFHAFRFDLSPEECTYEQFLIDEAQIPIDISITHPDKPLWEKDAISKLDFIRYMRKISSFMLPFLQNRTLTVIRYPHGIFGEPFYQKNCPDYAPGFIQTHLKDGIHYIVCNDLKTLMWLANQLSIEFHIPFHTISDRYVSEIVFDLDPPSRNEFHLAVKASQMMKKIFDQLELVSFIKTSGNKGLQVYIPLPEKQFSWDDTRLFTEFIANYLVTEKPDLFTIERLKKNRKGRLYVDFVQHAEGKTIIAPYSMRGHEDALIATPLFWNEVNEQLHPEQFTMKAVLHRMNKFSCPFENFFSIKNNQPFEPILNFLKQSK